MSPSLYQHKVTHGEHTTIVLRGGCSDCESSPSLHLYSPSDLSNLVDHMQLSSCDDQTPTKSVKITKTLLKSILELRPGHKVILVGYLAKHRQVDTAEASSVSQSSISQTLPYILTTIRLWDTCIRTKWPETACSVVNAKIRAPWRSQTDIGRELGISQSWVNTKLSAYRHTLTPKMLELYDGILKLYKHECTEPGRCALERAEEWILRLKCR